METPASNTFRSVVNNCLHPAPVASVSLKKITSGQDYDGWIRSHQHR